MKILVAGATGAIGRRLVPLLIDGGHHVVAATRTPLQSFRPMSSVEELSALLSELGGVSPDGLLGLEVIWTPADANDSMTETDVMTTYPELRSL